MDVEPRPKYDDEQASSTFQVCIAKYDLNKVRNPEMWPFGVMVRDWIFKEIPNNVNKDSEMTTTNGVPK